jgi:hypothetical protein
LLLQLGSNTWSSKIEQISLPLLKINKTVLSKKLAISELPKSLPDELDDVFPLKHQWPGLGTQGTLLAQLIAHTDPIRWEEQLGTTPEQLLSLAAKSEQRLPIVRGLAEATLWFDRPNWLDALISGIAESPYADWEGLPLKALCQQASPTLLLHLGKAYIMQGEPRLHDEHPVLDIIQLAHFKPDKQFLQLCTQILKNQSRKERSPGGLSGFGFLRTLARITPFEYSSVITQNWPEDGPHWHFWKVAVEEATQIIEIRQGIFNDFQPER